MNFEIRIEFKVDIEHESDNKYLQDLIAEVVPVLHFLNIIILVLCLHQFYLVNMEYENIKNVLNVFSA